MSRFALAAVLLAACAAPQQEVRSSASPGATQQGKSTAEISEDDEPVCHEESVTGSNMTRTVCRTKSQQERDRDDAATFRQRARDRQTITDL